MGNNFINPEENFEFSKLKGLDLQDLLVQVENLYLTYRPTLNLPKDVTFGVEIEYEGILKSFTDKFVKKNLPQWKSKRDGSLSSGGEISSPIMRDELHYWKELKKICDYLSGRGADTQHNAGGHVHIGVNALGSNVHSWKSFLKLYAAYESVLFRFIYGDKINARKKLFEYAKPIADSLYDSMIAINESDDLYDIRGCLHSYEKYQALSFRNVDFNNADDNYERNTLEFRSPNATTNPVIWQNNINAFTKMLLASKANVLNEDFLDYKLSRTPFPLYDHRYVYDEIDIQSVLEFVDLVFDNNLDKVYFLRQYLKDFQDGYRINTAIKAKSFVKSGGKNEKVLFGIR